MTNNVYGLPHESNRMLNFYKFCTESLNQMCVYGEGKRAIERERCISNQSILF